MKERFDGYYNNDKKDQDKREKYLRSVSENLGAGVEVTDVLLGTFARNLARRTNLGLKIKSHLIYNLKIHPGILQIFS